jgi:hypothetical protein
MVVKSKFYKVVGQNQINETKEFLNFVKRFLNGYPDF